MPEKIDFEAIWGDEEERAKKLRAALGLTDDTTTEVDAEAEPESAAQLIGVPVGDLMQLLDAALFAYACLEVEYPDMIAPEAAKQGRELLRAAIDPLMKLSREVGADEAEEKA